MPVQSKPDAFIVLDRKFVEVFVSADADGKNPVFKNAAGEVLPGDAGRAGNLLEGLLDAHGDTAVYICPNGIHGSDEHLNYTPSQDPDFSLLGMKELSAFYKRSVGYDPALEDPEMTLEDFRERCTEYWAEGRINAQEFHRDRTLPLELNCESVPYSDDPAEQTAFDEMQRLALDIAEMLLVAPEGYMADLGGNQRLFVAAYQGNLEVFTSPDYNTETEFSKASFYFVSGYEGLCVEDLDQIKETFSDWINAPKYVRSCPVNYFEELVQFHDDLWHQPAQQEVMSLGMG